MAKPVLFIFAVSQFCEKARWALDYLGVGYEIEHIPPGLHISIAEKLGAQGSSVPILVTGGEVVQGSADIVSWAQDASSSRKSLTPPRSASICRALETRLDGRLGVHVRRYHYSEALVEYPETVRPIFADDLGFRHKLIFAASWWTVRKRMIRFMDLGSAQGLESKLVVEGELDWLDSLLASGKRFLVEDQFSRADLAAASLLAPLISPKEHPTYRNLKFPPRFSEDLKEWQARPSLRWALKIYEQYRWA